MSLAVTLLRPETTLATVRDILNALDQSGRTSELETCGIKELGRLYELARDAPPITAAHFVGTRGPLEPVIHEGWNSLPLPGFARRFQKRFCLPEPGGVERIFGYNEGVTRYLIGPGYFQLIPTAGNAEFEGRGAWVVDYFKVPDTRVPDGWPWVVPNWVGPQIVIYHGTRDFMRKVSEHVSVGKPWARSGALPFCFTLNREDG